MISEPFKIKEVKDLPRLQSYERWNILKNAGFNTYNVASDHVTFDLVAKGMSSWSHHQKAGYMIGDEAYAGSRNYISLQKAASEVLGLKHIVPTHNGIGAEKLLTTTMLKKGQVVPTNRGRSEGLVPFQEGILVETTHVKAGEFHHPSEFGADVDLDHLKSVVAEQTKGNVAYLHLETCPDAWNGQPISFANLKAVSDLARQSDIPLVLDISFVLENAHAILTHEFKGQGDLMNIVREMIALADILLMDASQDCRSDVGGIIASNDEAIFERFRNQVVVFEGLHTYGGMTGRAMEVFTVGLREMEKAEYTHWYDAQVEHLYQLIAKRGVAVKRGTKGVALDARTFFPNLTPEDYPKFTLACCLYILGGIRARIDGAWAFHAQAHGQSYLQLELPRHAYTSAHLEAMADCIAAVWEIRDEVRGLRLVYEPEFIDEAIFEPRSHRLFVSWPKTPSRRFEPYKVAIFEPIEFLDKKDRQEAMDRAGYNTFLLDSSDIYIDFLTDSGTTAMSCYQWEGMTDSTDTPFTSRHYSDLVEAYREILGFEHIIPTHQGRAAEHIMSQVMIREGQSVPGNMYFTTTKLHQEMAGGVFVDVIVDQAHDPQSDFPWKGNIDVAKLEREIERVGGENVAYVSFEMSVNMAGGQPFSMQNAREVSRLCQKHGIPVMYDATRCVENAQMIKLKDPEYAHVPVEHILREMMSYGDGCTISCKKDFMVNMGGILACNDDDLAEAFRRMLRIWEGDVTTGGLDPKDIEALRRGLWDSLDDDYIAMRIHQTQTFGEKLMEAGVPIVQPPGSHAIFLDAKRFLPHIDQDEFPAQALAAAIYIATGVRAMERGNVSKGRNPQTGENYRPALELVRLTIPRRVYTDSHFDFVVEGIKRLWDRRDQISGLKITYEPKVLRFFQGRFQPLKPWTF